MYAWWTTFSSSWHFHNMCWTLFPWTVMNNLVLAVWSGWLVCKETWRIWLRQQLMRRSWLWMNTWRWKIKPREGPRGRWKLKIPGVSKEFQTGSCKIEEEEKSATRVNTRFSNNKISLAKHRRIGKDCYSRISKSLKNLGNRLAPVQGVPFHMTRSVYFRLMSSLQAFPKW